MANSQVNLDDSHDQSVESLFDFNSYYNDGSAEPDSTFNSEPQTLNQLGPSSQIPMSELHPDRAISSQAAATSLNNETAMMDISSEPVRGPSQPAVDTGNESLYRYEQQYRTDSPDTEIHHIDARIEEIDLKLERRKLQRRRQEILQKPGAQQARAFERPGIQTFGTASDSRTQFDSQGVTPDEASQGRDLFVSIVLELI